MGIRTPQVDRYIATSASFAQPILVHIRDVVHAACPDVVEEIKWSFPFFTYKSEIVCAMRAFKGHCGLFFWKGKLVVPDGKEEGLREEGDDAQRGRGAGPACGRSACQGEEDGEEDGEEVGEEVGEEAREDGNEEALAPNAHPRSRRAVRRATRLEPPAALTRLPVFPSSRLLRHRVRLLPRVVRPIHVGQRFLGIQHHLRHRLLGEESIGERELVATPHVGRELHHLLAPVVIRHLDLQRQHQPA
ncbi:MAG: DUF1801 domain-containing protein, partial [Rhodospirillaceae bacterium]|nr:DUF1801 domain-containing protein [Rhodospirillaceae bacterium]